MNISGCLLGVDVQSVFLRLIFFEGMAFKVFCSNRFTSLIAQKGSKKVAS